MRVAMDLRIFEEYRTQAERHDGSCPAGKVRGMFARKNSKRTGALVEREVELLQLRETAKLRRQRLYRNSPEMFALRKTRWVVSKWKF